MGMGDELGGGGRKFKSRMNTSETYASLRGFISEIKTLGLTDPVVRPEVAVKVLNGLTQTISSSKYQRGFGKNPHDSILDTLPTVTKDELLLVSFKYLLIFLVYYITLTLRKVAFAWVFINFLYLYLYSFPFHSSIGRLFRNC